MFYATRLRSALRRNLPNQVVFMKDWNKKQRVNWAGKGGYPVALMLHHTAAAATDSTSPTAKGNQKGANDGVINFIQNHYEVPAANFTLDRDGTVYVHSAYPVWHAGTGSFEGKKPWDIFGIPANMGNDYLLGVEIMSKGLKKDFTKAQKESLDKLQEACGAASKWPVLKRKADVRHPRHKDWTKRKIDIIYEQAEVNRWMT
jgi:N-acetyl-anhydromuramyl-L-alanine amidase AmpD